MPTLLYYVPRREAGEKMLFMCALLALLVFLSKLPHLSVLQQCLDMISNHTSAQQESFKLISSRQTCLLQCFNEYSSSCFSLHHLSGMHGQTELEVSKEQLSTVVSVPLLEISVMNIFRSYSQSPANKNTAMPHRPRNKLSPGTKPC